MKKLLCGAVLSFIVSQPVSAQRGTAPAGGWGGARMGGVPGLRPGMPSGGWRDHHEWKASGPWSTYTMPFVSPYGFSGFSDWGQADASSCPGAPAPVIAVAPPPEPPAPPPPPERASPAMHEYNWPTSPNDPNAAFALVTKDATVRFAIAVWSQDGVVHYVTREASQGSVPLDAIDRQATRRLNAEKQLQLWLPDAPPGS